MQTGLMRSLSSRNEPLSFRTSTKLPHGAFFNKKGDSGFRRNPLCFQDGAEGGTRPPGPCPKASLRGVPHGAQFVRKWGGQPGHRLWRRGSGLSGSRASPCSSLFGRRPKPVRVLRTRTPTGFPTTPSRWRVCMHGVSGPFGLTAKFSSPSWSTIRRQVKPLVEIIEQCQTDFPREGDPSFPSRRRG